MILLLVLGLASLPTLVILLLSGNVVISILLLISLVGLVRLVIGRLLLDGVSTPVLVRIIALGSSLVKRIIGLTRAT